jgi:two-component system, cell cycle sensor histidine kinase and response regulator CckA
VNRLPSITERVCFFFSSAKLGRVTFDMFPGSSKASLHAHPPASLSAQSARLALAGLFLLTALMWFSSRTLLAANFLPHWYCYLGNRPLLWSNVIADLVVGISYVAISSTLAWLVRRAGPDLPYSSFFWAFGLFIVSCGGTHFMEVVTVWRPVYWLSAAVKIVTAVASAGTSVVLLVAANDIVEFVQHAREAAARRGNEKFRAVIEAAPMAVISLDTSGRITAWNPAAEKTFGFAAAEMIGREHGPFASPERFEEQAALRKRTLEGQSVRGFETVCANRSGAAFPVSISTAPLRDDSGAINGIVKMIEDISEQKRIERELKEQTELFSTLTQVLNSYLDVGDWATTGRQLLGFAMEKTQSQQGFLGVVLEKQVLRVMADDGTVWETKLNESEPNQDLLREIVLRGRAIEIDSSTSDLFCGAPAGHAAVHSLIGVPIFKSTELAGLIAVANRAGGYTRSEIKHLEAMSKATGVLYNDYRQSLKHAALEAEQKRLEGQVRQAQKMEVLGRLAGGVAHDFNNMLMVLGGCTELLDRSLSRESPARMYLDQIQRTTEKATAITKQLLSFSRKQVVEIHPMDLHESLAESEFMLPRLLGSDIELTSHHDATKSWILSAPNQIEQVIANLAINARDAMPEGGRLEISTRNADLVPEDGADSPSQKGNWVVLEVSDTGTGIDEKTRGQLFEPFFTTKPAGKGTGLGLAAVYGIVKQSNGHIRVVSAPGQGARFQLYFPLAEKTAPQQTHSVTTAVKECNGNHATVLVADDEAALRHAVVEILRSSGYTVYEAHSATDALQLAEQHAGELDVLVTDIVMPGLRGPELARRVTQMQPDIRVVYMSGYAEGFPSAELPANSVFLQKPFRFATLLEQLKLVRRRG